MRRVRLGAAVVLVAVVPMLSGCMEALQSTPGVEVARPGPLPSATGPAPGSMSPAMPGSFAPDPATAVPTTVPMPASQAPMMTMAPLAPSAAPTAAPLPTLAVQMPPLPTNEERWRAQQTERSPFEGPRPYFTTGSELWWFDPVNQQSIVLGRITGDFLGQATFTLRAQGLAALEVPYQINQSYGLTALSPVAVERIRAAGFTDWVETYVFLTPAVIAR